MFYNFQSNEETLYSKKKKKKIRDQADKEVWKTYIRCPRRPYSQTVNELEPTLVENQ